MDPEKRQELALQQEDASPGQTTGPAASNSSPPSRSLRPRSPSEACSAWCCRQGEGWSTYFFALNQYVHGPTPILLDMPWKSLLSSVGRVSRCIPKLGLAPWDMLSPHVQERFGQWTPDAKRLWESDFGWHREALVRAWIWHYLDDNIFSFSPSAGAGELVKCSSPVWEHVRLLWQDLDVLRTRDGVFRDFLYIHEPLYRIQFHAWRRLTESLVRRGLGVEHFVNAADLVPHFKRSLRQLLADGETKLPDHPKDTKNWRPLIELEWAGTMIDWLHINIRSFLREARDVQYYIHGMIGTYALRFSPIGSDKLWGFPFDEKCMQDFSPPDIPRIRPGEALLPPVKLVSDPMLVVSGTNGRGIEADFTVRTRMQVVAPWTYGGEEADRHRFPGLEKGWEERDIKEVEERIAKEQKDAEVGEGSKQHDVADQPQGNKEDEEAKEESPDTSLVAENKGAKRKGQGKKARKAAKKARKTARKARK